MSGEQTFVIPDDELEKPVTINIDGDEPKPGDPPPQQSAPKAPPPVVQDPGIETLKQQLARERQGRLNAEKVAQELSQRNAVGSVALVDTHIQSVINEIAAVERDGDLAQQALADALATGNAAEAAKFQRIIARVESQRSALEAKKIGMENYKQQQAQVRPEGRQVPQQQQPQSTGDIVEDMAANLTPASGDWLRRNPQYARDEGKKQELIRAHHYAISMGVQVDTPEYFQAVEERIGMRQAQPPQTRQSPAAPASRDTPTLSNRQQGNTVTLTPEERATARELGMTEREYAIQKHALIQEGKLGTTRH